jgi:hypothetical protein
MAGRQSGRFGKRWVAIEIDGGRRGRPYRCGFRFHSRASTGALPMSNAEVIALIDAVLSLPVSDPTKSDLRSFRLQVQAGTIVEDDRNYIIKLCQRLQQGKGEPSVLSGADDKRAREEAEDRRNRIERWHQTGHVFESTPDLKWLYFDLALRGVEEWETERELSDFIERPIWESVYWRGTGRTHSDELITQAARYVDRPLFHCTALRDFFIVRLTESLLMHVHDPIKDRLVLALRPFVAAFLVVLAIVLAKFAIWWAAAIVALLLVGKGWGWLKEIDHMQTCKGRNRLTRNKISGLVAILKRGGFDEPTVICQLEVLDYKNPPRPKLKQIPI